LTIETTPHRHLLSDRESIFYYNWTGGGPKRAGRKKGQQVPGYGRYRKHPHQTLPPTAVWGEGGQFIILLKRPEGEPAHADALLAHREVPWRASLRKTGKRNPCLISLLKRKRNQNISTEKVEQEMGERQRHRDGIREKIREDLRGANVKKTAQTGGETEALTQEGREYNNKKDS